MNERDKLRELLIDVFLLEPDEYNEDLEREDVETWDSLGVVSLAVGIDETFGYHPTPEEAVAIASVADVVALLESNGISFEE